MCTFQTMLPPAWEFCHLNAVTSPPHTHPNSPTYTLQFLNTTASFVLTLHSLHSRHNYNVQCSAYIQINSPVKNCSVSIHLNVLWSSRIFLFSAVHLNSGREDLLVLTLDSWEILSSQWQGEFTHGPFSWEDFPKHNVMLKMLFTLPFVWCD